MFLAITRKLSRTISDCELVYADRQPIDFARANLQHRAYELMLSDLGISVLSLPAQHDMPDAVFVEDVAVVLEQVAVITPLGSSVRRRERENIMESLNLFRPCHLLPESACLEGGDVIVADQTILVGQSTRTLALGTQALERIVSPFGYSVVPVPVSGCLHLKTGCTYLGNETFIVNEDWIDPRDLPAATILIAKEPQGANVLSLKGTIVVSQSAPRTEQMLADRGFRTKVLDIEELERAEAGLTCMSILLEAQAPLLQSVVAKENDR